MNIPHTSTGTKDAKLNIFGTLFKLSKHNVDKMMECQHETLSKQLYLFYPTLVMHEKLLILAQSLFLFSVLCVTQVHQY